MFYVYVYVLSTYHILGLLVSAVSSSIKAKSFSSFIKDVKSPHLRQLRPREARAHRMAYDTYNLKIN